ncbi:hypothetical protein QI091_09875 [Staphylococcus saprophyticus]|uniref:hypothetical protein n=1 Tax=Staphylococcus saprophyticus TaxID=29385 RepID=UPI000852FA7D|nr:hypothetical protein [Staphylococcus saprophyticus]MDW4255868.1 hypothetical protein [Staphylococcus saprophyticus]OEK44748.1 hypothetical protein ASS91_06720 [Staphylococcus saprophyticus]
MKNYYSKDILNWNWTDVVINNFLNSFKKFNAYEVDIRNQEYVGVYGPTQVGKTTFILTFIGIKDEYMKSLTSALRGKQGYGKSSTVTATLYQRTENEKFLVVYPDQTEDEVENFDDLEICLKKFREKVTNSVYGYLEEMIIKIPSKYFYSYRNDTKDLIIIDLPGDDTKDVEEVGHVEQILNKYLLICRTIIILELGYKLNSLHQITNEAIKNWKNDSNRFIIALTEGVTNKEIKRELVINKNITREDIIRKYKKDVESDNKSKNKIDNIIVFFELGDSLKQIRKTNDEIYYKVINWNEKNVEQVLKKIRENESPEFRIRSLSNLTNYIEKKKKEELNLFSESVLKKESEIKLKETNIEQIKSILNFKNEELKESETKWEKVANIIDNREIINYINERYDYWKKTDISNSFKNIKQIMNSFTFEIKKEYMNKQTKLQQFSKILPKSKNVFDKIYYYLDNYEITLRKSLFGRVDKNQFLEEINIIKNDLEKKYFAISEIFNEEKKYSLELQNLNIIHLEKELENYYSKRNKNVEQKADIIYEKAIAKKEWEEEIAKVRLLNKFLLKEYSKHVKYLKNEIKIKENKEDKMVAFLLIKAMTEQIKRVLVHE